MTDPTTSPHAHLTPDEHCLTALDAALNEQQLSDLDKYKYARGFVAGWQERGIDQHTRGMATVNREYLAALEVAADTGEAKP